MRTMRNKPKLLQPVATRAMPRARPGDGRIMAPPAFSGLGRVPGRAPVQMKRAHDVAPAAGAPLARHASPSSGRPLDPAPRALLEQQLQQDFGGVRVHADARAADSASAIGARAYTMGDDIFFGRGEYRPGTAEGTRLIAHELAHVVQQRRGVSIGDGIGRADNAYERQADAVANAVASGQPAGALLASHAGAGASGGGVAIQRQEAPPAPTEEPERLVTEGDYMRKAVIDAASGRKTNKTEIMSQADIDKIRAGYTQEYTVKVDGKDEKKTRTIPPMANYTTCVEFAGQTFADAMSKRSDRLKLKPKERLAAGRLLSDAKRKLDAEYQLQAEIDAYTENLRLNRQSLEDPRKPDRRGRKIDGPNTRLAKAIKAGEDLQEKKQNLDSEEKRLAEELAALVGQRDAALGSGDKDRARDLAGPIQKKRLEVLQKHQEALQAKGQMVGQAQMIQQLKAQIRGINHECDKLKAKIDGRQAKLDEMHKHDKEIVYAKAPLNAHPKRGEYVLLGAGARQGYGVSTATTVTLGKGAFKHIAVFGRFEEMPSPPDKPHERWEIWHTIDGGGLVSEGKSIKICMDDLRVAPGASEKPWFASSTMLIGWIDMDELMANAPANPAAPAGAVAPATPPSTPTQPPPVCAPTP